MNLTSADFLEIAKNTAEGRVPDESVYDYIADLAEDEVDKLFPGADYLRGYFFGREIHLCSICNAKSGSCSENCCFCPQSAHFLTKVSVYPIQDPADLRERGAQLSRTPVNRYSLVISGRGPGRGEAAHIAEALAGLEYEAIDTCASLGILEEKDLEILRRAGVNRYHHNLESAGSHFPKVCNTHRFEDRIKTIQKSKEAGFSICAGGVFGIGESDRQVLEMALTLRELEVDAVPVNFLVPVKGTPVEHYRQLTPMRCLKIISIMRYVLPEKEIIVCGGRRQNLNDLQALMFYAGASGMMTGDYLTTSGCRLDDDLELLRQLKFSVRSKHARNFA